MATKKNPGTFDCYKKADPDEPMFILLGRDPTAATMVRAWVLLREHLVEKGILVRNEAQINEALELAKHLEFYATALGKEKAVDFLKDLDPLAVGDTDDTDITLSDTVEPNREELKSFLKDPE